MNASHQRSDRARHTASPLLASCHDAGGVHVIDVPVDYSENDLILNREIKELSSAL